MASNKTHKTIAIILFVFIFFILDHFGLGQYSFYGLAIIVGALTPDFLEPALTWKHRNFFHSKRFLKLLLFIMIITLIVGLFWNAILYLTFFILGYISHLFVDSFSKVGLPN